MEQVKNWNLTQQNVAQSVRAPVLYTGGRRFDSCHSDFCKYRRCCLESEPTVETAQKGGEMKETIVAEPLGCMGYMSTKNRLYSVDFTCSNCGKYHEEIIFGTKIKCECGATIDLRLSKNARK